MSLVSSPLLENSGGDDGRSGGSCGCSNDAKEEDPMDWEEETVVLESRYCTTTRRSTSSLIRQFNETLSAMMNRLSLRTFCIFCLFIIAVAAVSSVRSVGELNGAVPELSPRSLQASDSFVRSNAVAAPPQRYHSNKDYRKYPWTFKCVNNKCQRELAKTDGPKVSFDVCWLTCGKAGALWPVPGRVKLSQSTAGFYPENFFIRDINGPTDYIRGLVSNAANVSRQQIVQTFPEGLQYRGSQRRTTTSDDVPRYHSPDSTIVEVYIAVDEPTAFINEYTDESYQMDVTSVTMGTGALVKVSIKAATFFGARHALESMSQIVAFDEPNQCLQIVDEVHIEDGPAYPIRGLMIDTARNYIPINNIYRMVDALSYNKMNVLHWHISDSNSFPFESKSVPQMSLFGAYDPDKVYSIEAIRDLVQYALGRGVKIIPELDAPAHAGNGWQWGRQQGYGDLAVCVGKEPWRSYCGQPPCGQLNPINDHVYAVLEKLYAELLSAFDTDLFHMGGDEVLSPCWNEIPGIHQWMQQHKLNSHVELWGHFHQRAFESLKRASKGSDVTAIVWSSGLTASPVGRRFIKPQNFIVQIWDASTSSQIHDLLSSNYKVIFSNVDSMYLDMGGGTWLGREHDYRYENWQKLYDNDLDDIVFNAMRRKPEADKCAKQVLGGIATLWTEKVDENNMDVKLWPRGSAAAERLWSNPKERRDDAVYARLNVQTKRLKARGVRCSTLQPESCLQMTGNCDDPRSQLK